jgi:hypothetical protein
MQDSLVFSRLSFSRQSGSRHATLRALADNDGMEVVIDRGCLPRQQAKMPENN